MFFVFLIDVEAFKKKIKGRYGRNSVLEMCPAFSYSRQPSSGRREWVCEQAAVSIFA